MIPRSLLVAAVGMLVTVAACGSGESDDAGTAPDASTTTSAQAPTVAPFHAIPADSVFVSGTGSCNFSGGEEMLVAECEFEMSDPRVSGAERESDFEYLLTNGQPEGSVWVAHDATITNAEGTWQGSVQGTDLDNSGSIMEAHYFGEGAYDGLEFRYYLASIVEDDVPFAVHGWISGGG